MNTRSQSKKAATKPPKLKLTISKRSNKSTLAAPHKPPPGVPETPLPPTQNVRKMASDALALIDEEESEEYDLDDVGRESEYEAGEEAALGRDTGFNFNATGSIIDDSVRQVDGTDDRSIEEEVLDAEVGDNESLKELEPEEVEELFRVPLPVTV